LKVVVHIGFFRFCPLVRAAIPVAGSIRASQKRSFSMKNQMFVGISARALAFTVAIVRVDAFAPEAQAAEMKINPL
jgi:hypothetical protein